MEGGGGVGVGKSSSLNVGRYESTCCQVKSQRLTSVLLLLMGNLALNTSCVDMTRSIFLSDS